MGLVVVEDSYSLVGVGAWLRTGLAVVELGRGWWRLVVVERGRRFVRA